jgi:hypothetical protein
MKWKLICLGALFFLTTSVSGRAQEPDACDHENPSDVCAGRIAESRPKTYSFKRALHPFTWFQAATDPLIRFGATAASGAFGSNSKTSFIRLDINREGPRSGYGPELILSHRFSGPAIGLDASALYTYRRYANYAIGATFPLTWSAPSGSIGRLSLETHAVYSDRRSDAFYGIGNESPESGFTTYRSLTREAGAGLLSKITSTTTARLQFLQRNIDITPETPVFTSANLHSFVLNIRHDTKDNQELPSRGGIQMAEASLNNGSGFSYWKFRLRAEQYIPLNRGGRSVLAFRAGAEANQERHGTGVPFADLPYIGGWETVRGWPDQRFYDKSVLFTGVEYRYRIWQAFDWGFFLDAGQVASDPGGFGWNSFHPAYGVRLITRPTPNRAISIDAARSSEGWQFYFIFHPSF